MPLILILIALALPLAFNACGPAGMNAMTTMSGAFDLSSISGTGCILELKKRYATTYFPMLSTSCNRCHGSGHGSKDFELSFVSFKQKGQTLIDYQATHPHGEGSPDLSAKIPAASKSYAEAEAEYLTCKETEGSPAETDPNAPSTLKTSSVVIPTLDATNWRKLEWILPDKIHRLTGQIVNVKATLHIEAKLHMYSGSVSGIQFQNPTLTLAADQRPLKIEGLRIYLDEQLQSSVTTYANASRTVTGTVVTPLAPQAGVAFAYYPSASKTTGVALELTSISETLPENVAVTWRELTSAGPKGVFFNNCTSCHGTRHRLNLTNYTSTVNSASTIVHRMNSRSTPMPASGLLSQDQRDLVQRWIDSGTPY